MKSVTDAGKVATAAVVKGSTEVVEPIQGPVLDEPLATNWVEAPRLARHQIELPSLRTDRFS